MVSDAKKNDLYRQGYRLVGKHSAIKVCEWTKKSLKDEGICYKEKFYDTECHRCVQMTPALDVCSHRCVWCWRDIEFTKPKWGGEADDPKFIIDGCIKENIKYLQGLKGFTKTNLKKFKEMYEPQQFAISLSGEPTMYPKLPEFILELRKRKINSFLVTNGTNPAMLNKLLDKEAQPTQLYITIPAPNEEVYVRVCSPLVKNGWKKILKSLSLLSKFKRNVFRLTLVKNENMINVEEYADLIRKYKPKAVECKGYVWVGFSRERLGIKNMPYHEDVMEFARQIIKFLPNYVLKGEKKESRVVLLAKKN